VPNSFRTGKCCRAGGDSWRQKLPSYLHGHSGVSRAILVIQGVKRGRLRESGADLGHSSAPVHSGKLRDPLVPGSRLQTHGPAGSGGRLLVIMQPRRLMGTSRTLPIGWPQRGPGVRRPHVRSGLLEPRRLGLSSDPVETVASDTGLRRRTMDSPTSRGRALCCRTKPPRTPTNSRLRTIAP
jgi:hypothetical protein